MIRPSESNIKKTEAKVSAHFLLDLKLLDTLNFNI